MRKRPSTDADAVFADAARVVHPTDGPLNAALLRIAALEREVDYLGKRVDVLVDLLASDNSE